MKEKIEKTYRAIRHDIVRERQKNNHDDAHHPEEKINQIITCLEELKNKDNINILELFAGEGNCTTIYSEYGQVLTIEKNRAKYKKLQENINSLPYKSRIDARCGDSFINIHMFQYTQLKFDVIDIDPYGFPNRFFPDIFLLIDKGYLFVTMPKPFVNILNGITQTHLISYFGEHNPSKETILERIALWGLCHWRKVELIDSIDCQSVWRFCFAVEKVKATDYTGVRNR